MVKLSEEQNFTKSPKSHLKPHPEGVYGWQLPTKFTFLAIYRSCVFEFLPFLMLKVRLFLYLNEQISAKNHGHSP